MLPATQHYSAILASYADKRHGRPDLLATLCDFERLRAVYEIACQCRVSMPHKNATELLRLGGGQAWVDLHKALSDQAAAVREPRSEGAFVRAQVRMAAEMVAPATGFYEAIDAWMTRSQEAIIRYELPAILTGVSFLAGGRNAAKSFTDDAAASGIPLLVARMGQLEHEANEIVGELLPTEQANEVVSVLSSQRLARLKHEFTLPVFERQRGLRMMRFADLCVGRTYLDRQSFFQRSVASLVTIDACIDSLAEVGRLVRIPASAFIHSGAGFCLSDLHMRRGVFFQESAPKLVAGLGLPSVAQIAKDADLFISGLAALQPAVSTPECKLSSSILR